MRPPIETKPIDPPSRPADPRVVVEPVPQDLPNVPKSVSNTQAIVTLDGLKGVFIPLDAANLTKNQSSEELAKTIDVLQAALLEKNNENLKLREQNAQLLTPPQSPDDFASALQSAVDTLQTKLSQLSNPVSNFAVKEFKIDTRVGIKMTPLGMVEFRFSGPGERLAPESLSQLSLTLVPVEKPNSIDPALAQFLRPLQPISTIEDMAEVMISQTQSVQRYFEANHIYTIGDFLKVGSRIEVQARIVAATQIKPDLLEDWFNIAQLLLIKGMTYDIAKALGKVGIKSMEDLSEAAPDKLAQQLIETGVDQDTIRFWCDIAARYLAG
jgi:hypothetical protein